jgi:hypothetical protein
MVADSLRSRDGFGYAGDQGQLDLYGSSQMHGDVREDDLRASTQSIPKLNNQDVPRLEGKELFRMAR